MSDWTKYGHQYQYYNCDDDDDDDIINLILIYSYNIYLWYHNYFLAFLPVCSLDRFPFKFRLKIYAILDCSTSKWGVFYFYIYFY